MNKVFSWLMAFAIVFLVLPLALIWSINTLFGLAIPYTFKTVLASLILIVLVRRGASVSG